MNVGSTSGVCVSDLWLQSNLQNRCKPFMADHLEEGIRSKEDASLLQRVSTVLWIKG